MIGITQMNQYAPFGYPELLRRQSSQWAEARNIQRSHSIVEWPNQDRNYAKLDDCMGEFKRFEVEFVLNNEEDKLEEPFEQPSLFNSTLEHQATYTSETSADFKEGESSFEDAIENYFRQMTDDEEPKIDSSCDLQSASASPSSCK